MVTAKAWTNRRLDCSIQLAVINSACVNIPSSRVISYEMRIWIIEMLAGWNGMPPPPGPRTEAYKRGSVKTLRRLLAKARELEASHV